MIASPHFAQTRLVRWLTSSRFAIDARAVFESSPFLGIDSRPLSPIFLLLFVYLDFPSCMSYLAMRTIVPRIESTTVYHSKGRCVQSDVNS